MILQFWLGAILLLIIAAAVFVFPFIRGKQASIKKEDKITRNQLNRSLYELRLAEIERDDLQGLIVDKEKVIAELQHNLLDDINDDVVIKKNAQNKWILIPGLLVLVFGSVALYLSVGAYKEVSKLEVVLDNYDRLTDKLFSKSEGRPSEQELKDIMLGLRVQLSKKPDDAKGWLLYSRLAMVLRSSESANDGIDKAYALDPTSIDIRLVYIELKMQSRDEYDRHQAARLVEQLLQEDPTLLDAWSMYAFMAVEKEDFKTAITRWNKMLTLVNPDSEQAGILRDSIGYAEKKIAEGKNVDHQVVCEAAKSVIIEDKQPETVKQSAVLNNNYQLTITLADNVVVPRDGFLFVFA
ncbi:MAG TPA: c-type cytochrome biogenesis protein CcmI, partial [Psychromonas hadalis]|nr:c-type cytochrome biogenesis protein CcmI [Psychromonas hadalis]